MAPKQNCHFLSSLYEIKSDCTTAIAGSLLTWWLQAKPTELQIGKGPTSVSHHVCNRVTSLEQLSVAEFSGEKQGQISMKTAIKML